jgi:hypothetical protein
MKKIIPDRFFPVLGIWAIALSSGFWIYAVEAEVHMAGLFFVVAGIYLLFFNPPTLKNIVLSSLLLALSCGFHLTNVLICFSVLFYFIHERRTMVSILQFYFFYALFIAVPYLIYAVFSHQNLVRHFLDILFGENMFSGYRINRWEGFSIHSILNSVKAVGAGILWPVSDWLAILSVVILAGIILTAFFLSRTSVYRRVLLKISFWIIPFFLFFCFWESRNIEFKLGIVAAILILFIFSLSRLRNKMLGISILIGLVLILFLVNFYGSIKPRNDINSNRNYLLARAIGDNTAENSSIYIAGSGRSSYKYGKIYIPYFALRNVIILDWKLGKGRSFDLLKRDLHLSLNRGEPVYFLSEITHLNETVRDLIKKHGLDPSAYNEFLKQIVFSDPVPLIGQYSLCQVVGIKPNSMIPDSPD